MNYHSPLERCKEHLNKFSTLVNMKKRDGPGPIALIASELCWPTYKFFGDRFHTCDGITELVTVRFKS